MTQNLTLYHYWRSSCSWRVRWALTHKGVKYDDVPINLLLNEHRSPDFLAKNPSGFVPALVINGESFGESMAILEWIEETFPHKPLLPQSPLDRMRVRQMCLMIISGTQPLQNLSVMRKHSSDPAAQAEWSRHWITLGLQNLENLLANHAGTFCFGGQLSLADICLVPQIFNANRFNVNMDAFPIIKGVHQNCLKLPECDASAPHNQKGATA
jgi:maleylacetoacetate isomerase